MSNPTQLPIVPMPPLPQPRQSENAQQPSGVTGTPPNTPMNPGYSRAPMGSPYPIGSAPSTATPGTGYQAEYPNAPGHSSNAYPANGYGYPNGYPNGQPNGYPYAMPGQKPSRTPNTTKGMALAIASLAVSICGVIFFCLGIYWIQFLVLSVLLGIVGIVLAAISKHAGYKGALRTAGFIISIVILSVSGVCLVSCIGCASFAKSEL